MMPIRPFWWDVLGLVLCLAGFALLALTAEREGKVLLHRPATVREQWFCRLLAWPLLIAGLFLSVWGWRGNFGPFLWFGWLTVAALAVVFAISYWPWRMQAQRRHAVGDRPLAVDASPSPALRLGQLALVFGLVALPVGFGWAVAQVPLHPLLRADAVHGQLGPWSFTLAEEDAGESPEATPSGVFVKHLLLRFCDACDADIRAAYLQLREPVSPRALGLRFMGERWEREVALSIPPGISVQDQLWLSVVDKDGRVHRTAVVVADVSPALVRFIEEQKP